MQRWVFHIATIADWERDRDRDYRHASLEREGFIHCSLPEQLPFVVAQFFLGQTGLLLLGIDRERLVAELRFDPVGERAFPHLYGALNRDAVFVATPVAPETLADWNPESSKDLHPWVRDRLAELERAANAPPPESDA